MEPEDDKEDEPGKSWPPGIPDPGNEKAIRPVNYRKPGAWAWAIIWALAIGRTLLLWVYIVDSFVEDEMPHSDTSALDAFGKKVFPEIVVTISMATHYGLSGVSSLLIMTALVFFCTFVFAYLVRVFVVAEWLRYRSRMEKEREARDEVRK